MTKQLLFFIEFEEKRPGGPILCRAKTFKVDFKMEDVRHVWTLPQFRDPAVRPALPYAPIHHTNAFIEDPMHDWNIYGNKFRYAGRIDQPVWILVELKDKIT